MKQIRVGIAGSAGTSKTTIAASIANSLGIPLLASKFVTSEILKRDGYDYSSDIQVERFLAQGGRQDEMLAKTIELESKHDSFITDRTVIDLAAYANAELYDSDPKRIERFFKVCREHSKRYTHIFMCPWGLQPLKANNVRTLNPWYQHIIHSLDISLMQEWGLSFVLLNSAEVEGKIKEVMKILKP